MKRMMLIGALLGFSSGFGLGMARQIPMQDAFWHACVAAYAGGMLMRWWGRVWFTGLRESHEEQLEAAAAAAAAEEEKHHNSVPGRP